MHLTVKLKFKMEFRNATGGGVIEYAHLLWDVCCMAMIGQRHGCPCVAAAHVM